MDSRIGIVLVVFFFWSLGKAQEIEESIAWDAQQKLVWEDFKGPVPPDAAAAATTASGISYEYKANLIHHEVQLDFKVTAFFYPNESWYRPEVCDANVLQHEQLHFDISELFARKMRLRLQRTAFTENVKSEVRTIYKEILKQLSEFQDRYDWETNFSRNKEAQNLWNQRISEALSQITAQ
ncbi:MAG: DUF922 domain-containing protein [Bacteroidota bacterium]